MNKAKNLLWAFLAFAAWPVAGIGADGSQEMSRIPPDRVDLHLLVFWICLAIGLVVFVVMFYSFYHHRKLWDGSGTAFYESPVMESLWALIPFAILIGTAMPATRQMMSMGDQHAAEVGITVTVDQCGGGYGYVVGGVSFASEEGPVSGQVMIIPVGRKIWLSFAASAVSHAWSVPGLGWSGVNTVAGVSHESWLRADKPGIYRGQCSPANSTVDGIKPFVVDARIENEYAQWVQTQDSASGQVNH
ncbi:MAG: hypothetical protein NZ729_07735 [Methylococcales bacterium]|nr:hypothetical protein [Methylococcales bacterium]